MSRASSAFPATITVTWPTVGLVAVGLGMLWVFAGLFVAIIWPALWLSIGAHEFGHARCATALGIDVPSVDVGAGPKLARFDNRRVVVTLRLVPIVGWTTIEELEPAGKTPAQLDRAHRRRAAVFLAGPTVSLAVGVLVCMVGFVASGNHVVGDAVSSTLDITGSVAIAPVQLLASNVDWINELCCADNSAPGHSVSGGLRSGHATTGEPVEPVEPSTIIGFTETGNDLTERYGIGFAVVMIGALNLDLAVMNMFPVWGLDGHGFCTAILDAICARRQQRGRWLTICLRCVTFVTTISIVLVIIRGLCNDLF